MKKTIILLSVFVLVLVLSSCSNNSSGEVGQGYDCSEQKESAEYVMNIPKKVKPEYVSAYKLLFGKCQTETLKEEACIEYELFQSVADSTEFHIYEIWANRQGQREHAATAHLKEFVKETKVFFDEAPAKLTESYIISCD